MGHSSLPIVVGEGDGIMTRVVELHIPVALGDDIHGCRGLLLLGKEIFEIGKVV